MLLSPNGIKTIIEQFEDKNTIFVDLILQVVQAKEPTETRGILVQEFKLSDGQFCSPTVVTNLKELSTPPLKNYQLMRVKSIRFCKQGENKLIFVKEQQNAGNYSFLIGDPVEASEEEIIHSIDSFPVETFDSISSLTTFSKEFTLKVRVNTKSLSHYYTSALKKRITLSFVVIDEEGNEMQICCFNQIALELEKFIEEGSVYLISEGSVVENQKKYNGIDCNFKVILDEKSTVTPTKDLREKIPLFLYKFVSIKQLENIKEGIFVDVVGKVSQVNDKYTVMNKQKIEVNLRKIVLIDDSEAGVEVTLWKAHSDREIKVGDYFVVKRAKVSRFNGRSLGVLSDSNVQINPDLPEIAALREYFGARTTVKGLIKRAEESLAMIEEIKREVSNAWEQSLTKEFTCFRVNSVLISISLRENNFYRGCPTCRKKLADGDFSFQCLSCNKNVSEPRFIYRLSGCFRDVSGEMWVDLFGDTAEKLVGISAKEFAQLVEENQEQKLKEIADKVTGREYLLIVRPRVEEFNNEVKKRFYGVKLIVQGYKTDLIRERNAILEAI